MGDGANIARNAEGASALTSRPGFGARRNCAKQTLLKGAPSCRARRIIPGPDESMPPRSAVSRA